MSSLLAQTRPTSTIQAPNTPEDTLQALDQILERADKGEITSQEDLYDILGRLAPFVRVLAGDVTVRQIPDVSMRMAVEGKIETVKERFSDRRAIKYPLPVNEQTRGIVYDLNRLEAQAGKDLVDGKIRTIRRSIAEVTGLWHGEDAPRMAFFSRPADFLVKNQQKGVETFQAHMLRVINAREAQGLRAMYQRGHLFLFLQRRGMDTAVSGVKLAQPQDWTARYRQFERLEV